MSAAVSLRLVVNASAPLSTKRCSRPASRPTTRTFFPFERRKLATIEPVFPLAPKITYISCETTDDVIFTASLVWLNGVERRQGDRVTWLSLWECVAKHGNAADRFGLSRLVLQNVPMLSKKTVFESDNIGGDPGG